MAKKRAAMGFRSIMLAEVTTNDATSYVSTTAVPLLYAGTMSKTPKETTNDFYYDDGLYFQLKEVTGEDVEIRVAEVPLAQMATLGMGTFDVATNTFEGDFSVDGKEYALRFLVDTVSRLPYYFNYRLFQLTSIKFDNFATKGDSTAIAEVIITGVLKRPDYPSVKPFAIMQLDDGKTNQAACDAFLKNGESFPASASSGSTQTSNQ